MKKVVLILSSLYVVTFPSIVIDPSHESYNYSFINQRNKRAVIYKNVKWIFPIKYSVGSNVNSKLVEDVLTGIRSQTCITFQKVQSFSGPGIQFKKGASCGIFSSNNSPAIIGIAEYCGKRGKIQKKTLNILGLLDEEDRPNRNNYVTVNMNNVIDSVKHYLVVQDSSLVNSYNIRYDYGSIMHNGKYYVSKNGKMTIVPKDKLYFDTIGQIEMIGFNDIKCLNLYYCSGKCSSQLNCLNGGYTDPNNCSVCRCPRFFTGKLCNEIVSSPPSCGTTKISSLTNSQILTVSGKKNCIYQISAPPESKVKVIILNTNLPVKNPCPPNVGLEVKFSDDKSISGATFCGIKKNITITSLDNLVLIKYSGLKQNNNIKISYKKV
uniref:Metalloendopeptidase n=1 Tax=Parastrongyloides trichosuri TaxID=131310 RepID=A0A0N5A148_PARTI